MIKYHLRSWLLVVNTTIECGITSGYQKNPKNDSNNTINIISEYISLDKGGGFPINYTILPTQHITCLIDQMTQGWTRCTKGETLTRGMFRAIELIFCIDNGWRSANWYLKDLLNKLSMRQWSVMGGKKKLRNNI